MAKFLNTTATNYMLEELIKNARERLILISPFLKLNERMRELLEDKNRMKIDIRVVYGKSELHPDEANLLKELEFVRTSFCSNLHAKCYMSEDACIITSLNLYDFSQINNNEMGVFISREEDGSLFREAYDEAQRLVRISEEVRIAFEKVPYQELPQDSSQKAPSAGQGYAYERLTIPKLAEKHGVTTQEMTDRLVSAGLLELRGHLQLQYLTEAGKKAGATLRKSNTGYFTLWPRNLEV